MTTKKKSRTEGVYRLKNLGWLARVPTKLSYDENTGQITHMDYVLAGGIEHHRQQVQQWEPVLRQLVDTQFYQLLSILQNTFLKQKNAR